MSKTAAADYDSMWQRVLGELEISMSHHSYKTFVKQTSLVAVTDGVAEINVPNPFSSAQLKARFF